MQEYSVFISDDEGYLQEIYVAEASSPEEAFEKAYEGEGETVGFHHDRVGNLSWVEDGSGTRFEV